MKKKKANTIFCVKFENKIARREKEVVCLVKTTLDIFINISFIAYFKEKENFNFKQTGQVSINGILE